MSCLLVTNLIKVMHFDKTFFKQCLQLQLMTLDFFEATQYFTHYKLNLTLRQNISKLFVVFVEKSVN